MCVTLCKFCAFYRRPGDPEGYDHPLDVILEKIRETKALGGVQILLQGGHHPAPVVVDAEQVEGHGDGGKVVVAGLVEAAEAVQVLEHVARVAAAEQRVEEQPVVDAVDAAGGVGVAAEPGCPVAEPVVAAAPAPADVADPPV